jgi:hypothetical protein
MDSLTFFTYAQLSRCSHNISLQRKGQRFLIGGEAGRNETKSLMRYLIATKGKSDQTIRTCPHIFHNWESIVAFNHLKAGLTHKASAPDIDAALTILQPTVRFEIFHSSVEGIFRIWLPHDTLPQ